MVITGASSMTLAMKKLHNLGWFALVFIVAILLYPLSMNVATVHSDLVSVDRKIRDTKREISFLQAEIRTRASMQQLQEWNKVLYGYQSPTAEQFLNGENALASLSGPISGSKPVLVSVMSDSGEAPAGVIGSPFAKFASAIGSEDLADSKIKQLENNAVIAKSEPILKDGAAISHRTEALANMDEKLLSNDLMQDIQRKSEIERKRK
jgi:hypothetical protein